MYKVRDGTGGIFEMHAATCYSSLFTLLSACKPLKLVAVAGNDPAFKAYEACVTPVHFPASKIYGANYPSCTGTACLEDKHAAVEH